MERLIIVEKDGGFSTESESIGYSEERKGKGKGKNLSSYPLDDY